MAIKKSKNTIKKKKTSLISESNLPDKEQILIGKLYVGNSRSSGHENVVRVVNIEYDKDSDNRERDSIIYEIVDGLEDFTWRDDGYYSMERGFFNDYYGEGLLKFSLEEYKRDVQALIEGKLTLDDFQNSKDISDETALMQTQSKEYLQSVEKSLDSMKQRAEVIRRGVQIEIEKRKKELEQFTRGLGDIVEKMEEQINTVRKVIATIELYLGINEDIIQIQEGAPSSETIHFWQNTMFIDEEVGNPLDGGLDFERIDEFDEWLLQYSKYYKKKNYEVLIPQSKGLCVLRVRRETKERNAEAFNVFARFHMEEMDFHTYILIRNGDNIYRVWGKLIIYPKLFPNRDELQELKDLWDKIQMDEDGQLVEWGEKHRWSSDNEKDRKKIQETLFRYKQNFIMLQGLIDRTSVFHPIPEHIDLMKTDAQDKGLVQFVYEDDYRLSDGKPDFWTWMSQHNESIQEGSRILYVRELSEKREIRDSYDKEYFSQRYDARYRSGWKEGRPLPPEPQTGIYIVKKYKTKVDTYVRIKAESIEDLPKYAVERYSGGYDYFKPKKNGKYEYFKGFPYYYIYKDEKGNKKYKSHNMEYLAIYYNPKDEVTKGWDYWGTSIHERKNNISYKIYPRYINAEGGDGLGYNRKDDNIFNYDTISLEELDYYLFDRKHRRDYLNIMPILWELKKNLEEEKKKELEFVKGLIQDMQSKNEKISNPKESIWEAVEWYKKKNKWKRYLREDDDKAWRMIRKRLGLSNGKK